jgi:hypothetical protein
LTTPPPDYDDDDGLSPDKLYSQDAPGGGGSGRKFLGKRLRQENGLVELTKKFIELIQKAPE